MEVASEMFQSSPEGELGIVRIMHLSTPDPWRIPAHSKE